jgi:asparagine synthase (glutamine-hydrolysing)
MTWVKKEHRDKIWRKELLNSIEQKSESEEIFLNHQHLSDSLNANRVDIETYLPGDLLYKVDIASMAHSLEVRAPFLNHHLFQFGISLQDKDRVGFFSGKKLLKEFASEVLPSEIIKRKKQGFGIPREKWLRNELKPLMHALLNSESYKSSMWFNQHYVRRLVKDFEKGEKIDGTIWVLMMIELWARENMQT